MSRWGTLALLVTALLEGCASARPNFQALYDFRSEQTQPPLIVIPGILGSRLYNTRTSQEIWPGSAWNLLFDRKESLALDIDPDSLEPRDDGVEPRGLFEAALGTDFYGEIVRTLEHYGHYERGTLGQHADREHRRYYVFAYDWRQDNVVTARKLDALIQQIRVDYGDPTLKVDILAHSMGGLVARYYARYGMDDVLDDNEFHANMSGGQNIHTLILLGTPNLGSADSLHGFIEGARVGLRRIPTEVLATTPSFYELFPHPLSDWLIATEGKPLDRDLFDVETWRRFEWSVFDPELETRIRARALSRHQDADAAVDTLHRYFEKRLERARRFVWSLTVPLPAGAKSRMIVLGGDCTPTPARLLVEEENGDSVVRLFPDDVKSKVPGVDYSRLMLEPGDGEVTKPSLLARESLDPTKPRHRYIHVAMEYSFLLCEQHNHLTANASFQDNLLNLLLSGDHPWDEPVVPTSPKLH